MKGVIVVIVIFISSCEAGAVLERIKSVGQKAWEAVNYNIPDKFNPIFLTYTNSCIEDLGCFYTGPPFYHPVNRPVSVSPSKRVDLIYFLLYTPLHTKDEFELQPDPDSVQQSAFDPGLDTKIIIHGFLAHLDPIDFRFRLKDAMLEQGDYNVVVVDWGELNFPPYSMAVANCRVVGAQIAKLIHCLMDTTGAPAESFHIIGHSLGSHIAGYAGERVHNLGRITGLDPAGPWFRDTEPEVRLDPNDALFVDILHTDGAEFVTGGLGINAPIGHMDFYPNGGSAQPGCVYTSSMNNVLGTLINDTTQHMNTLCDHGRANEFYLESIDNSECKFIAVQCSSYDDFEKGMCQPESSRVAEMGFHSKKTQGLGQPALFFLRTRERQPYCDVNSIYI